VRARGWSAKTVMRLIFTTRGEVWRIEGGWPARGQIHIHEERISEGGEVSKGVWWEGGVTPEHGHRACLRGYASTEGIAYVHIMKRIDLPR